MKTLLTTTAVSVLFSLLSHAGHSGHSHGDGIQDQAVMAGGSFVHTHASPEGVPYVHSFGIEPALAGRDLVVGHTYIKGDGFSEHEVELELEWAFNNRFGVIVEVPYIFEDVEGDATTSGVGDLAVVPRVLLVNSPNFLLTGQMEIVLPTGSSAFGGETALAPGVSMWNNLGGNFTLNSQLGVEHSFDGDSTEFFVGLGLVHTFGGDGCGHDYGGIGPVNLHLELTGSTPLNGGGKGDILLEGLVGFSCQVCEGMDFRAGYIFPVTSPKEIEHGVTSGLIFHF